MDIKEAIKKCTKHNDGDSVGSFKLVYDAPDAHLESIYFWLLEFMEGMGKVEKVTDNFTSSPGSGHFAEMGGRATRMQEEGMKILGAVNQVVKSVLNLVYDLKEFEIRLGHYEKAKSKNPQEKEAAMLALKQIWLDNVDMKRGRGSITQMTYELGFSTLRTAFMTANTLEEVDKNEIVNDELKRIVKPRLAEFLNWAEESEKELRKRFEIEKSYLRSQVETIKLYTSWAKPYLKAAQELQQKGFEKDAALVSAFNTSLFQLVLFGKSKLDISKLIFDKKKLPLSFENYSPKRDYFSCMVIGVTFRGFPQKVTQQAYGFGGKVTMTFDAYALNQEELDLVKKTMEKDDVESVLKFSSQTSEVALTQLKEDLDKFLGEDKKKEEKKKDQDDEGNPFKALYDLIFKKSEKKEDKKEIENIDDIKKDDYVEKELREIADEGAKDNLYAIYDVYKKAHMMPSSPENFEAALD